MVSEIGAGIGGAVAGLGSIAIVFRWLNSKIDKKQDKSLCNNIAETFSQSLNRGEEKFDKIMETLTEIQIATGKIEQRLNNKS